MRILIRGETVFPDGRVIRRATKQEPETIGTSICGEALPKKYDFIVLEASADVFYQEGPEIYQAVYSSPDAIVYGPTDYNPENAVSSLELVLMELSRANGLFIPSKRELYPSSSP
jgi:hypothetical protein